MSYMSGVDLDALIVKFGVNEVCKCPKVYRFSSQIKVVSIPVSQLIAILLRQVQYV